MRQTVAVQAAVPAGRAEWGWWKAWGNLTTKDYREQREKGEVKRKKEKQKRWLMRGQSKPPSSFVLATQFTFRLLNSISMRIRKILDNALRGI
jgi:hypothetical protein